ncbi:hypothetical protein WJR50_31515 [Catalinimonas sp. 4WD22]|uniref:hypothetical protein n=1 Tax=Catalinimonas locisalis TaxID=3133978 RepID=UPI003101A064
MNRSWRELTVMLKWRYPYLKEKDFTFIEGKKEKMLIKLAVRIKMSRSDLDLLLEELQHY